MTLTKMFEDVFGSWLGLIGGYFQAALGVFSGSLQPTVILSVVGIVCLVIGVILSIVWREKQSVWMIGIAVVGLITFPVLAVANSVAGWIGMALGILVGAALLLVCIGLISAEATKRMPIWLLGAFVFTFAAYSSLPSIAYILGGV